MASDAINDKSGQYFVEAGASYTTKGPKYTGRLGRYFGDHLGIYLEGEKFVERDEYAGGGGVRVRF